MDVAPVVPGFTAWCSPLLLLAAHGSAAVALGVLARAGYGYARGRTPPV